MTLETLLRLLPLLLLLHSSGPLTQTVRNVRNEQQVSSYFFTGCQDTGIISGREGETWRGQRDFSLSLSKWGPRIVRMLTGLRRKKKAFVFKWTEFKSNYTTGKRKKCTGLIWEWTVPSRSIQGPKWPVCVFLITFETTLRFVIRSDRRLSPW